MAIPSTIAMVPFRCSQCNEMLEGPDPGAARCVYCGHVATASSPMTTPAGLVTDGDGPAAPVRPGGVTAVAAFEFALAGFMLAGATVLPALLFLAVLSTVLGVGLLRGHPAAYVVAVAISAMNIVAAFMLPGGQASWFVSVLLNVGVVVLLVFPENRRFFFDMGRGPDPGQAAPQSPPG